MRSLYHEILASLERGDTWEHGKHYSTHTHSKVRVWIANNVYGMHIETPGCYRVVPPWGTRWRIWRAIKRHAMADAAVRLAGEPHA